MIGPSDVAKIAADRAFSAKLVTNIHRGLIVEAIVSASICPEWTWCSEDYYRYDFVNESKISLEVKQSAACQSWPTSKPSIPRWDIAVRKGYYEGEVYTEKPGRNADIYVLAWHPIADPATADHRDPSQWAFFVIRAVELPPSRTIGMSGVRALAQTVGFDGLRSAIAQASDRVRAASVVADPSYPH